MKKCILSLLSTLLLILLIPNLSSAQIIHGDGAPKSWENEKSLSVLYEHRMPAFDVASRMAEDDEVNARKDGSPWRFAYPHYLNLGIDNAGKWDNLPNGDRIWRLHLSSKGALNLNIIFSEYVIPEGGEVFIYTPDRSEMLGPFTHLNNKEWGSLGTTPIHGSEVIVEYYEPKDLKGKSKLKVGQLSHGYRDVYKYARDKAINGLGDSGSCNNNTICGEWDEWRCEMKSVVILLVGGSGFCSGTLINNTAHDGTPFILTANHCVGDNVTNWVCRFHWASPECNSNLNGPTNFTISGATLLGTNPNADGALIRVSEVPPESYDVYYSGWDATGDRPEWQVGIHHPAGDVMKISLDEDPAGLTTNNGGVFQTWEIGAWDDGTTEPGSSGSGLWDDEHRIIGQLWRGSASCSNTSGYDEYGRFDLSYELIYKSYLDPGNTGELIIEGIGQGECGGSALTANFSVNTMSSCDGVIEFTDLSRNATKWSWEFGDGATSDQQNPTHTYDESGTYTVTLSVEDGGGETDDFSMEINVNIMEAPNASDVAICAGESASLSATGTGTINWYDAPTGGNLVGSGSGITTDPLFESTSFYVDASSGESYNVGPEDNQFGDGGNFESDRGLIFDVSETIILNSIMVYGAETTQTQTIEVTQGVDGAVVASVDVEIPQGDNRVTLNLEIPAGNGLFIHFNSNTINYFRNSEGASYPYTNGPVSIIRSTANNSPEAYYYFFYDWEFETLGCVSARTEVNVTVSDIVELPAESVDKCDEQCVEIVAPEYDAYLWSTGATTQAIEVCEGGVYTVELKNNDDCDAALEVEVISNELPPVSAVIFEDPDLVAVETSYLYQWYLNDQLITGATNQRYTPDGAGVYHVILTDTRTGCSQKSELYDITVGVFDESMIGMYIYPNPLSNELFIVNENGIEIKYIRVYNIHGVEIYKQNDFVNSKVMVDLSTYTSGTYLLEVATTDHVFRKTVHKN